MRTTVDIPDPVYRRLKTKAAQRGCSEEELVLRGVVVESAEGKVTRQTISWGAAAPRATGC